MANQPPLVVHLIHRLDVGGLENGLVNLINAMPPKLYRHAIVCMTDFSDFRHRIKRPDVKVFALHKQPGKDFGVYLRLWKLLRQLRPSIMHTRNLSALEGAVVAVLAGVPHRIHGEHGRDIHDIDGRNKKYLLLRRLCQNFVQRYICVSRDLEQWLLDVVGVPARKVKQVYNGVDSERFHPFDEGVDVAVALPWPSTPERMVIGTVGRMEAVKDQANLARAFVELIRRAPELRAHARLVLVGDGSHADEVRSVLAEAGIADLAWLPGNRNDVADLMRAMDVFVLPSRAEGISNTILEAMSTGLPVVATRVGGNPELVIANETGMLVPASDPVALASALLEYARRPQLWLRHGSKARERIENEFSIEAMVDQYLPIYDALVYRLKPANRYS